MGSNDAALGRVQYDSLNVDLSRIPGDRSLSFLSRSSLALARSLVHGTQITEKRYTPMPSGEKALQIRSIERLIHVAIERAGGDWQSLIPYD